MILYTHDLNVLSASAITLHDVDVSPYM